MQPVKIDDLRKVVALADLPDEHLQWILDHTEYQEYADGDLIAKYGQQAEVMWIGLEGKVAFYMYLNGRQVYFFTFENNNVTGGIGGLMPYSRMKTYPGYSYAVGEVKMLRMHKMHFQELEHLNPDFIQRLIGYMTERARIFATTQLQFEKVNALGNLAAGIAHELNNPAAAINRIASELHERLFHNYELSKQLLQIDMTPDHLQKIRELIEKLDSGHDPYVKRSALERMENEDEMADWLEENGITDRSLTETFVEFGFTISELEMIRDDLGKEGLALVLPWLENLLSSQKLIKDLDDASKRISNLVGSIKSHVHMDRTSDMEPTNIHQDLENTLTLLGFKLREKNIQVRKKYCENLIPVPAFVGELNQVWTNLIDNAIAAMENDGILTIETTCDPKEVRISIIDNGKGIPKENISRIFDPFFTTKKVGEGTGIGLDIVSRIIKHHDGDIKVFSEPGNTKFSVCIPAVPKQEPAT